MSSANPIVLAVSGLVLSVISVAACSGSLAPISDGGSSGDRGIEGDAMAGTSSSSSSTSSSGSVDSGLDTGKIDPPLVTEKPAPACNDLTQHGTLVATIGDPNPPPAQNPIASITPGLYVVTSTTEYGASLPIDPISPSKTTVVFTTTRQYYLWESDGFTQALTLDWKLVNNRLLRTVICAQQDGQLGKTVDYRIDAAQNGFIIYVPAKTPGGPNRVLAHRYTQVK